MKRVNTFYLSILIFQLICEGCALQLPKFEKKAFSKFTKPKFERPSSSNHLDYCLLDI